VNASSIPFLRRPADSATAPHTIATSTRTTATFAAERNGATTTEEWVRPAGQLNSMPIGESSRKHLRRSRSFETLFTTRNRLLNTHPRLLKQPGQPQEPTRPRQKPIQPLAQPISREAL
jgi:hypothetical protein